MQSSCYRELYCEQGMNSDMVRRSLIYELTDKGKLLCCQQAWLFSNILICETYSASIHWFLIAVCITCRCKNPAVHGKHMFFKYETNHFCKSLNFHECFLKVRHVWMFGKYIGEVMHGSRKCRKRSDVLITTDIKTTGCNHWISLIWTTRLSEFS